MRGWSVLLLCLAHTLSAEPPQPLVLQAETRIGHLMEEMLPQAVLQSETADRLGIRREPVYQSATPLYRRLTAGSAGNVFAVVVDPGPVPRLWIDLNRNGDLTDDYLPPAHQEAAQAVWDVMLPVESPAGQPELLPYRVRWQNGQDVNAQARYGLSGRVTLDGKQYACLIQPAGLEGRGVIWGIDLNGDTRIDGNPLSGEHFEGASPFNADGHTYQLARRENKWQVEESDAEAEPKRHIAAGEPAPDFSFTTLTGAAGTLHTQHSWVLLDFWASWCRPCWDEFPRLRQLRTQAVTILGVALEEGVRDGRDSSALNEFVRSRGIDWPVIYDHPGHSTSISRLYNVDALPVYVLIDPAGKIRWIGRAEVETQVKRRLLKSDGNAFETPGRSTASP